MRSGYGAYDGRSVRQQKVALINLVLSIADIDLVRISLRAVVVAVHEQLDEQWATFLPTRQGGPGDQPR